VTVPFPPQQGVDRFFEYALQAGLHVVTKERFERAPRRA
jgi:hypothetical protein